MRLTHLTLHNFRNYVRLALDLLPGVTVLVGDNAQGKTNLLEAIYYLATTRSPHAGSDRELVHWLASEQEPLPYARLVGHVSRRSGPGVQAAAAEPREQTIEITLTKQQNNAGRYRKQIRINGVPRRAIDLLGELIVVLFLPEDIGLVADSPALRRRYLDIALCQIDPGYCRALSRYNEVVTQRNALLRDLGERGGDPAQLAFWDGRLVEDGAYVIARRRETIVALEALAQPIHGSLTDSAEWLNLRYLPSLELGDPQDLPAIRAAFEGQLAALRQREIAAGMTLLGPHRDELRFLINEVDAGVFGSRGQQRTVALSLKLAEVELMRRESGEYPVLLLDDVLSELDGRRRHFLVQRLDDGPEQAIITATDLPALPGAFLERCHFWRVEMGQLRPTAG